jgi:hypothetical protein
VDDEQCPKDAPCTDGPEGRFCYVPPPEPITLPLANAEAPMVASCAAAPLPLLPWLGCVFAALAVRRRRNPRG